MHMYAALYVIVKALLRVCMKNTAQGECRVVNTARGEAECCIYYKTPPSAVFTTRYPRMLRFIHTSIGSGVVGKGGYARTWTRTQTRTHTI